jgi:transposase
MAKSKLTDWQRKILVSARRCGWTLAELSQFLIEEYGVPLDGLINRKECWMTWKDLAHLRDFQEWKKHRIRAGN